MSLQDEYARSGTLVSTNFPRGVSVSWDIGKTATFETSVTLTSAQILAMNNDVANSVLLIPHVPLENQESDGSVIVPTNILIQRMGNGGTAYTGGSSGIFHYAGSVDRVVARITQDDILVALGKTVRTVARADLITDPTDYSSLADCSNKSLYLNVSGVAFATGNASMKINISYMVVSL